MLKYLIDFANGLTLVGLLCGVLSIVSTINEDFQLSIIFMLLAVVCDVFDGFLARRFRKSNADIIFSQIGLQFDSLSDLVHSGIAPGFLVFFLTDKTLVSFILLFIIVTSCYLRLAYYNCNGLIGGEFFSGLPVFYSPMILALIMFINNHIGSQMLIYLYAVAVPALHIFTKLKIKKFQGIPFYIFLLVLLSEILISID